MSIEATVEKFIREEILHGTGPEKLERDTSLIDSGVLDSLTLLRLITFIEEHLGVDVEDDEVIPDYFESIGSIKEFVEKKK